MTKHNRLTGKVNVLPGNSELFGVARELWRVALRCTTVRRSSAQVSVRHLNATYIDRSLGTDHRSAGILPVTICHRMAALRLWPNYTC